MGNIVSSTSPWASGIVLVPKESGETRLCTDFRRVNESTVADPFPLPRVEDLIDRVGRSAFLTKIDMTTDFWQIPMDEESQKITATVTRDFHFEWKFMPFSLKNAPATFSRLVAKLLHGLEGFAAAYLDDIIIFSDTWKSNLKHITAVFQRIREANLTLNKRKCYFATAEVDFLGHHVGLGKVQPKQKKVEALLSFPRPTTKKQLQSYLGVAGFYRKYVPHYASISAVLFNLLKKVQDLSGLIQQKKHSWILNPVLRADPY